MQPKRKYKVELNIKNIRRATPKIVSDGTDYCYEKAIDQLKKELKEWKDLAQQMGAELEWLVDNYPGMFGDRAKKLLDELEKLKAKK